MPFFDDSITKVVDDIEREKRSERRRVNKNRVNKVNAIQRKKLLNSEEFDSEDELNEAIESLGDPVLQEFAILLRDDLIDLEMLIENERDDENNGGYKVGADDMAPPGHQWVYVFVVNAKLITTKIIKHFTKQPYNHSALSFDKSLTNMVSFSIGGGNNGFVRENLRTVYRPDATFSLYKIAVPNRTIVVMKDAIRNIEQLKDTKDRYKYSFKGLLGFVDKHHQSFYNTNEKKMFCSQFVARIFSTAGMKIFNKEDYEIRPYDFATNKNFKFCYKGTVKNFDPSRIR